ncbi:MAG: signal peptidase I [Shewanella sp.]|nr:signal peptidase I [Shewanella sp.]
MPSSFFLIDIFVKSFIAFMLIFVVYLYKKFSSLKVIISLLFVIYSCSWLYLVKTKHIILFNYAVGSVNSNSMSPALIKGDYLIYKKKDKNEVIKRGSIVSTTVVGQDQDGVIGIDKRVAGIPGDVIYICDYEVLVNGVFFYKEHKDLTDCLHVEKFELSKNSYYLLGDNKFSSYDSRFFGSVKFQDIDYIIIYKVSPNSDVTYF